jgi:amidase
VDDAELCSRSAGELVGLMGDGSLSARDLVEATLRRIDALNPRLNAFRVVRAEQALADADRIDAHRDADEGRPLLGLPVAVKDDTDVAGEVTVWGRAEADGPPAAADSPIVARLRAAGAIIIGKTHVPELTLWPWTTSPAWGPTRNPWDPERTPGGSSGGSAVAVAAGLCALATGTDGGGSIRYPAALTGVVGLKPQRDRIPLGPGHEGGWNGLLTLGALTRTVEDTARFLDATADRPPPGGYRQALTRPQAGLRIAVSYQPPARSLAPLGDDRRRAVEATAELLRDLGHHVEEREVDYGAVMANSTIRYLCGVHDDVGALDHADHLQRTTRRIAALGGWIPARTLARARLGEDRIAASINQTFRSFDLVLTPMNGAPPPRIADLPRGAFPSLRAANVDAWAVPWNVIGQPAVAVPAGLDGEGLPLAVQVAGPPDSEAAILAVAAQIESARPWASAATAVPALR